MDELDRVMHYLAKLPGLGPRSARRAVLHLLRKRETLRRPLADALGAAEDAVRDGAVCGNLDACDPCHICKDESRDGSVLCVVADVGDVWALERAGAFKGRYHVLGGLLSALDGVGPDDLNLDGLISRSNAPEVKEVILAMDATVDGQTTAHYISDRLDGLGVVITRLARGVPVGGELDFLDDGTLTQALKARRAL